MGGPLGEKIVDVICTDCWGEWRAMSGNLINHRGLNLGMPEHREQLRKAMKACLDADKSLVTTALDHRTVLHRLIATICTP